MSDTLLDALENLGVDVDLTLHRSFANNRSFYAECICEFPSDPNMDKLRAAVSKHDSDAAEKAVHALKGLAANLGFLDLLDQTMKMLKAFRGGEDDAAFTMLPQVEQAYQALLDTIEKNKD